MMTLRLILLTLCFTYASTLLALPPVQTTTDEDNDASLTLRLFTSTVEEDSVSFCQLELVITEGDVNLTNGDTFSVSVFEDDVAADDLIFELIDEPVTVDEVTAGRVERVINCSAAFPDDVGDSLEIYATARVMKDACSGLCIADNPETSNLEVLQVGDDDLEDNDTDVTAANIGTGLLPDRVAADADWYNFTLPESSHLSARLDYQVLEGRIDGLLNDEGGSLIAFFGESAEGSVLDAGILPAGAYRLRLINRVVTNTVFYDLEILSFADDVFGDSFENGQ